MKITDHAIQGGIIYPRIFNGFGKDGFFYVLDAVELPIISSDSRVEITWKFSEKATTYSMDYLDLMEKIGRCHKYVGLYHSHPCFFLLVIRNWLFHSKNIQIVNKTWFALVVAPYRTKSNSKIYFGCFWLYKNEKSARKIQRFDSLPLNRTKEFGVHQKKYYRISHYFFQSKSENNIV